MEHFYLPFTECHLLPFGTNSPAIFINTVFLFTKRRERAASSNVPMIQRVSASVDYSLCSWKRPFFLWFLWLHETGYVESIFRQNDEFRGKTSGSPVLWEGSITGNQYKVPVTDYLTRVVPSMRSPHQSAGVTTTHWTLWRGCKSLC